MELFRLFPEPIELLVLAPDPIELFRLTPDPIELLVLAPDPIELFRLFPEPIELLVLAPDPIELLGFVPRFTELPGTVIRTTSGKTAPPSNGWVPTVSTTLPATTSERFNITVAPLISTVPRLVLEMETLPLKYTGVAPGTYCPTEIFASFFKRTKPLGPMLPVMETYGLSAELFASQIAAMLSASFATKLIPSTVTVRARQFAISIAPMAETSAPPVAAGNGLERAKSAMNGPISDFR
jgi:hypothetical protein